MKWLMMFTLICGVARGQMGIFGGSTVHFQQQTEISDAGKKPYLLIATSMEKCYDCGYTYAVACAPGYSDCGIPYEPVPHYFWFNTKEEALAFLEENQNETLVSLVAVAKIAVEQREETIVQKQPDLRQKVKHYAVE